MDMRGSAKHALHPVNSALVLPPVELAADYQMRQISCKANIRNQVDQLFDLRQVLGKVITMNLDKKRYAQVVRKLPPLLYEVGNLLSRRKSIRGLGKHIVCLEAHGPFHSLANVIQREWSMAEHKP